MENCVNEDAKCAVKCNPETIVPKYGNTEENTSISTMSGIERLNDKKYSKGLAFTIMERQILGIHGLLPPAVKTAEQQVEHSLICVDRWRDKNDKLTYLMGLHHRNQRLFFQTVITNIEKFLPLIYTPTIFKASQIYGINFINPHGMFITIRQKERVSEVLSEWPEKHVRLIVVTDGEHIKDYGDLGVQCMAMAIGKTFVYTVLGGLKPSQCLPIALDVGTKNKNLLRDPLYIGMKRQRQICGCIYDNFLDEFMEAVVHRYGRTCLVQFENFSNHNAFRLLEKYREKYCMFNYDVQGIPAIVMTGIFATIRLTKRELALQTILLYDTNEESLGIAKLFMLTQMQSSGSERMAKSQIWIFDEHGLVVRNRPSGGLTPGKAEFARKADPIDDLVEAIEFVRPNVLIGASSRAGAFTTDVIKVMAKINERPLIFVMSNSPATAECTAEDAIQYSYGKCIFASGVLHPPVEINFRTYYSNYIHHVPVPFGVALGVLCAGMRKVPTEVLVMGADTFTEFVTAKELSKGIIYPVLTHTKAMCIVIEIARWIMEYAYKFGLATVLPEPQDKIEFIKSQLYDPSYQPVLPEIYLKDDVW